MMFSANVEMGRFIYEYVITKDCDTWGELFGNITQEIALYACVDYTVM